MTFKFFLSYKRLPSFDKYVEKFFKDLTDVLESRGGKPEAGGRTGFLDQSGIETGDHWESKLVEGLNHSRTLVCLFTAPYLASEFCGKEFEFFQRRLDKWKEGKPDAGDPPPVILPVLWEKPKTYASKSPPTLLGIQY